MKVELTDEEIVVFDGKCNDSLQELVEKAKRRLEIKAQYPELSEPHAQLIADAVGVAVENGHLDYASKRIPYCLLCKESGGYVLYKRNSQYHDKGEPNRDKPIHLLAFDLSISFITFANRVSLGGCLTCWEALKPSLQDALKDVKAELPERLMGTPSQWKRYPNMGCTCGWSGHRGEMLLAPVMMGPGRSRQNCPDCGKGGLLNSNLRSRDGFVVVPS